MPSTHQRRGRRARQNGRKAERSVIAAHGSSDTVVMAKQHPQRLHDGRYIGKEGCDFLGFALVDGWPIPGELLPCPIALEVKSSAGPSIAIWNQSDRNIGPEQVCQLAKYDFWVGSLGLVLVNAHQRLKSGIKPHWFVMRWRTYERIEARQIEQGSKSINWQRFSEDNHAHRVTDGRWFDALEALVT